MQFMLALGGFWRLRCGNILTKKYSTSQENNYLAAFIIYIFKYANSQFMLETITSS